VANKVLGTQYGSVQIIPFHQGLCVTPRFSAPSAPLRENVCGLVNFNVLILIMASLGGGSPAPIAGSRSKARPSF
jgi:hypothetical protein